MNNDINKSGYQQLEGDKNNSSRSTDDINKMMCNLLLHQSAPDVEIDTFKGDPLKYHYFMSVFTKAVEKKVSYTHGRLMLLLKFTERENQRKPSNIAFSNHRKGYMRELKYCWNTLCIMGIHTGYLLLTVVKSKLDHC